MPRRHGQPRLVDEGVHLDCGTPWDEHEQTFGGQPQCPDRVARDLSPEQRERVPKRDSRPFEAAYPGPCALGDWIEQGDEVCYVDDELQHVKCKAGEEAEAITRPVRAACPRCFIELPVSGVCGTCD